MRQALAHAIDRDALLRAVYFEHAVRAPDSILPNTRGSHHPIPDGYRFDPERGSRTLSGSRFSQMGLAWISGHSPVQRGYNPNARLMAERHAIRSRPKLAFVRISSAMSGAHFVVV